MNNGRFAIAIHVLTMLAVENREGTITSEYLARSASTNPVVIRRILGVLQRAGLVTSRSGAGGGVTLQRKPEQITLLEVYCALGNAGLFSLGRRKSDSLCIYDRDVRPILADVFTKAEQASAQVLAGMTIAGIVQEIDNGG